MNIWNLLFPEKCIMCGDILERRNFGVCRRCRRRLPVVEEPLCMHCGKPLSSDRQELCYDCHERTSLIKQGTALWEYTDRMRQVMADFKYKGAESEAEFFASELMRKRGKKIRLWNPDIIVPVPLHRKKRWFRGYNQAESIAVALGELAGIPVEKEILIRSRYTAPQKDLGHGDRLANLKNAITVKESQRDKLSEKLTVLLIDDIYTTGATLDACASALSGCGVSQIYSACLCIGKDDGSQM